MENRHPTVPGRPASPCPVDPVMFAEDARAIMRFASQEARRLHCQTVGAKHILLGLLKEGSGMTPSVLTKIERDFSQVRNKLLEKMESVDVDSKAALPFTTTSLLSIAAFPAIVTVAAFELSSVKDAVPIG